MQPSPYKKAGKRICTPIGWYMSEKFDGMKGRWIDGKFWTRSGQKINAPKWFTDLLPKIELEGELYFGKNTFHRTGSLRSNSTSKSWENVSYNIFDCIDYKLSWMERQVLLSESVTQNDAIKLVKWKKVKSLEHLEKKYKKITDDLG